MQALVTNVDGAESWGLQLLADVARDVGLTVTAVGPTWNASGSSAALGAVSHAGQVQVQHAAADGDDPEPRLAVEATPAFIVRAALHGAIGLQPEVVLVGIHEGRNTGQAALHSGTLGAALTGALAGCPSLAISADFGTADEVAGHVARLAISWLLELGYPCALNVNIPNRDLSELGAATPTKLGLGGSIQAMVTEREGGFMPVTFRDSTDNNDPETDDGALDRGYVSVTALQPPTEHPGVDLAELLGRGAEARQPLPD